MKYAYLDYPTKKEIFIESFDPKEADARWEKIWHERCSKSEKVFLKTKHGENFLFVMMPSLLHLITQISEQRGFLEATTLSSVAQKRLKEKAANYEAYYSSRIEGADSSLEEALLFINKRQKYSSNESLQMIKNNRRALDYAMKQMGQPITHDLICKLQFILTENTHCQKPIIVGEYRHGPVYIVNGVGQVVYEGPSFEKVPNMMEDFIQWINNNDRMHPLIKAGIVHFYFVHVHPFDDGNGRTARALSNLVLANSGFRFINMLSLSDYFDHKRPSYYKAIQDVREHNHDLTYFLIFFMEALLMKLKDFRKEIAFESKLRKLKELMDPKIYQQMHPRHTKTLQIMLKTNEIMTTKKYCKLNKCSDETARKDFQDLIDFNLIKSVGEGRSRGYQLASSIVSAIS